MRLKNGLIRVKQKVLQILVGPFEPGKIYVFEYKKPKHIDRIAWFDANPVVLALDPTDFGNDCGINLNLLPP
jgi:hypothetical protein